MTISEFNPENCDFSHLSRHFNPGISQFFSHLSRHPLKSAQKFSEFSLKSAPIKCETTVEDNVDFLEGSEGSEGTGSRGGGGRLS